MYENRFLWIFGQLNYLLCVYWTQLLQIIYRLLIHLDNCFVLHSSTHRADFKYCNCCLILPIYKTVVNTTQGTRTLVQNNISDFVRWHFVLYLPILFLQTLLFVDDRYSFYGDLSQTFAFFLFLGDFLARINAATDFVIYILVSTHYRNIFNLIVLKRLGRSPYTTDDSYCCQISKKRWFTKSNLVNNILFWSF